MNQDPQNTPLTPADKTSVPATPPTSPSSFDTQSSTSTSQTESPSSINAQPQPTQAPDAVPEPAAINPFATQTPTTPPQTSSPPAFVTEPTAQTPITTTPDSIPTTVAPGVPFGDPAQPAAADPVAASVTPVAPGVAPETAKVALIMGSIGLLAWLLPIIGLPVTIIALVFAIKSLKRGHKHAKLALGFAIFGLVATLINAAVGGYLAYQTVQKSASEGVQSTSKTETLNTVPYPEESRTAFVQNCAANGGTEARCTCVLNEVEKQLTYEEFTEVDREISETGKVPDSFREVQDNAIAACSE